MRTVPDPVSSLASGTCTYKGISDGAAFTQVGVVRATWAKVHGSWQQRADGERCKGDETFRGSLTQDQNSNRLTAPATC